jgi:hypothetical protein
MLPSMAYEQNIMLDKIASLDDMIGSTSAPVNAEGGSGRYMNVSEACETKLTGRIYECILLSWRAEQSMADSRGQPARNEIKCIDGTVDGIHGVLLVSRNRWQLTFVKKVGAL